MDTYKNPRTTEQSGISVPQRLTGITVALVATALGLLAASCSAASSANEPTSTTTTTTIPASTTTQAAVATTAPTTTVAPTTTTTQSPEPEISAEHLAMAEGLVAAHNGEDYGDLRDLFTDDVNINIPAPFSGFATGENYGDDPDHAKQILDALGESHEFETILGARWTIDMCSVRDAGGIRCALSYADAFTDAIGRTWEYNTLIDGEAGAVSSYRLMHGDGVPASIAWQAFFAWLADVDPEDADIAGVNRADGWFPRFTREAAATILRHLDDYAASLDG